MQRLCSAFDAALQSLHRPAPAAGATSSPATPAARSGGARTPTARSRSGGAGRGGARGGTAGGGGGGRAGGRDGGGPGSKKRGRSMVMTEEEQMRLAIAASLQDH
jgi:hypothetical protein